MPGGASKAHEVYPETGFEEITGDVLERDNFACRTWASADRAFAFAPSRQFPDARSLDPKHR
jgi:hypothetical protein